MCIPNIKNAYENIVHACEKRLKDLYPLGVPEVIESRYKTELGWLEQSEFLDDFEIFRLLSKEGKKTSQYMSFRGMASGSLLVYLMGHNRMNPLQAHYYCKKCGHFEVVNTHLFGIDLPKISCPNCDEELVGDGFNLPLESVWGTDGKKHIDFDYNISSEFLPFAKRVIQKIYPENEIVSYGVLGSNQRGYKFDPEKLEVKHSGYVILPKGRTLADYPEITTYLEDGEPCITGLCNIIEQYNLKRVMLLPHGTIEHLMQLQRKSGIYVQEIGINELRELTYYDLINSKSMDFEEERVFADKTPQNFHDMVSYNALGHNSTFVTDRSADDWYNEVKEKVLNNADFKKYPCFTREDFFDYMVECGLERTEAFKWSEMIRKGRSPREPKLDELPIPEELKNVAKMYAYVFPRAHCIEYLLMYARMAYYMKWDSRVYSSVINKKKNNFIQYFR